MPKFDDMCKSRDFITLSDLKQMAEEISAKKKGD